MPEENNNKPFLDEQQKKLKDGWSSFMSDKENNPSEAAPAASTQNTNQPKSSKKWLIILIIIIIIIGLGAGGYFAFSKNSLGINSMIWYAMNVKTINQPDENQAIVEDMQQKAEIAKKAISFKYPESYLFMVNVGDSYEFIFFNEIHHADVYIKMKTEVNNNDIIEITFSPNNSSAPELLPINELKISWKKALEIFEKNGGGKFGDKNPNAKLFGPILGNKKGFSWLLVVYNSPNSAQDRILMYIDAKSGNIISKTEK
jgi:hypothetical protein